MPLPRAPAQLEDQVRAAIIRSHSHAFDSLPMRDHYSRMGLTWPPHGDKELLFGIAELSRILGVATLTVQRWTKRATHGIVQVKPRGPVALRYSAFCALCVRFRNYAPPVQGDAP